MQLFEYQKNVITSILSNSCKQQLISMPTGTGKTITFLSFAKEYNKKTIIIVHREELLNQTVDKAIKLGFKPEEISVFSSSKKEKPSKICVAMIQTIARNLSALQDENFELMIIDEAHHATADSYLKVIESMKFRDSDKLLIGFTATPLRSDGRILSHIFKEHTYKMTLQEATQLGYIVPVRGIKVQMDKSLEDVELLGNDYNPADLEKIMNCEDVNKIVVERCKALRQKPGIIFTSSINHAENLEKMLKNEGIKSASVNYKTPKKDLLSIYEKLKNNEIDFVANAVKLSEGFDEPNIRSVIIARPTRSPILYKQMIGRGLRNHPEKTECFVLEFTSNDKNMVNWDDLDQNSTFQAFTPGQIKTHEEAFKYYGSKFGNNIKVTGVRVSPFNFYECEIRRIVKHRKHFYYIPSTEGVFFFKLTRCVNKSFMDEIFTMIGFSFWWKKQYESFIPWKENWIEKGDKGLEITPGKGEAFLTLKDCESWIIHYLSSGPNVNIKRWYPSEEEPISNRQKKILSRFMNPIPSYLKGRKAEFEIEDWSIRKIIDKYFYDKEFPYDLKEGFI